MKRILLGTTGLAARALTLGSVASAQAPIKLTVGGYFKQACMVVADDDDEGEPGLNRNTDGFFNDAFEIGLGTTLTF